MATVRAKGMKAGDHGGSSATFVVERLPWRYALTVAGFMVAGVAEQALEQWLLDPSWAGLMLTIGRRVGLLAMAFYTLVMMKALRDRVLKSVDDLRPVVLIGDAEYRDRVRRMVGASRRSEWLLLFVSIAVVVLWFVVARNRFPISGVTRLYLPSAPLAAGFMLAFYSLLGWALLVLLYTTLRLGLGLGSLARRPLDISPYDTSGLLPFGRLAVLTSLSVAGAVLIMILALGRPNQLLDYVTVAFLSLAGALALVLPLRGVYRQMERAREVALSEIHGEMERMHHALFSRGKDGAARPDSISERLGVLMDLRTVIKESPRWPFTNEAAVARALFAALTPLIYFILNEVLRAYIVPYITRR